MSRCKTISRGLTGATRTIAKTGIFCCCLALTLAIPGCGEKAPAEKQPVSAPWQTQLDALEKAKGVEQQIMDADKKRREEIDRY